MKFDLGTQQGILDWADSVRAKTHGYEGPDLKIATELANAWRAAQEKKKEAKEKQDADSGL